MIKVYGIKTCGSVKNALKFFKQHDIEVEFCDFKKQIPSDEMIELWVKQAGVSKVFNAKGQMYRSLKLKDLNLDDTAKVKWLKKEFMLIKRPIVQKDSKVLAVGFDENEYKNLIGLK